MARSRVILAAILSCSLPQTSLSRASSSSLGAIVYADRAHLGAGNASAGTTIFPGDKLLTEPGPQGPRGAGAKDHKWPIKKPKFIWIPISLAIIGTVWAVHEALESPDRP